MTKGKEVAKADRQEWEYERSIARSRELVGAVRHATLDLVRELYQARIALSNPGFRSDKNSISDALNADLGQNCPRLFSWEQYCDDIGLSKRTANSWLLLYVPEEDRMMSTDEFRQQLEDRYQASFRLMQQHTGDASWRPDDWPKAFEARYQEYLRRQQILQIAQRDRFDAVSDCQPSLFDEAYLERLSGRLSGMKLVKDPMEFMKFCTRVKPSASTRAPIQKQVDAFCTAKAAIEEFEPSTRAEVARFIAEMLTRDAAGEFNLERGNE